VQVSKASIYKCNNRWSNYYIIAQPSSKLLYKWTYGKVDLRELTRPYNAT